MMTAGTTGRPMAWIARFKHLTDLMVFPSIVKFKEESGNVENGT